MPTKSPSVSSIQSAGDRLIAARMGWPLLDIMTAKVLVKRLVQSGMRKGPSELLVLSDHALEEWYTDDAVRYLQEQKEKRSKPVAELK